MKILSYFIFAITLCFAGCKADYTELQSEESIVIGSFFGECGGEQCVEFFRVSNGVVLEDVNDFYPYWENPYEGNFVTEVSCCYEDVAELKGLIPELMLNNPSTVYGCPDCADQGGFYFEITTSEYSAHWVFDNAVISESEEVHIFKEEVVQRLEMLTGLTF